jgi:hypothetical protein
MGSNLSFYFYFGLRFSSLQDADFGLLRYGGKSPGFYFGWGLQSVLLAWLHTVLAENHKR